MTSRFGFKLGAALLLSLFALAPAWAVIKEEPLTETAQQLQKKFSGGGTLEYHFMLKAPPFNDENKEQVVADLIRKLKPIADIGKISGPKYGSYIDTEDRVLDKARLILRLRPGLFTVKARSTSLNDLIDIQPCNGTKAKYELDFFEEPGFSISAEFKFKKEDWIADPTKATVNQTMAFMEKNCPALLKQMEVYLKPMGDLTAPGTANMYSADITVHDPLNDTFKESSFNLWTFPGSKSAYSLGELAWTGNVKDKAALELLYHKTREKLIEMGLLAQDQSSKTEQYYAAYFGVSALDTKYGRLAQPAYIKHFEADPQGKVLVSPYLQIATRDFPAYLEPAMAPYNYVIDADGHVAVIPETLHPYGRVYEKGFFRPEDKSNKKPGTEERYGHTSALGGLPGRISGEILYDKKTNSWFVNNKSGRYSKSNEDRTPEQLINAAQQIRKTVDIGDASWGDVRFIFEYGPKAIEEKYKNDPALDYEDAANKKRPRLVVLPASKH